MLHINLNIQKKKSKIKIMYPPMYCVHFEDSKKSKIKIMLCINLNIQKIYNQK